MFKVSTGTKRPVSPTRHHREPDLVIFFYLVEVLRKLPAEIRIERIQRFRPIQRDSRNVPFSLKLANVHGPFPPICS